MEADRYQVNKGLYILGLISLNLGLLLLFFSLLLLPHLIWHLHYDVPEFIAMIVTFIQDEFRWSAQKASLMLFLLLLIPALSLIVVSLYASNKIDTSLYEEKIIEEQDTGLFTRVFLKILPDLRFAVKLFLILMLVLLSAFLLYRLL